MNFDPLLTDFGVDNVPDPGRIPPPPPPPLPAMTQGQNETEMINSFSPLIEKPAPPLPAGFDSFIETFMPKEAFDQLFLEAGLPDTRLTPPAVPIALGFRGETNGLIQSTQNRMMRGLEPLFTLNNSIKSPQESNLIKLVAIAYEQTIAQLSHVRRVLTLTETWGTAAVEKRRLVLKSCYDKKIFKADDKELFNQAFVDIVRYFTPSSNAPTKSPTFVPKPATHPPSKSRYTRYSQYKSSYKYTPYPQFGYDRNSYDRNRYPNRRGQRGSRKNYNY